MLGLTHSCCIPCKLLLFSFSFWIIAISIKIRFRTPGTDLSGVPPKNIVSTTVDEEKAFLTTF